MATRVSHTEAEVDENIRHSYFADVVCTIYGYYLPTKFQVNRAIQTGYNLGRGGLLEPPPPPARKG